MKRRSFLSTALAVMAAPALAGKAGVTYEVTRSEDEWRAMLTDAEFRVMREEGTERAFTSPLNDESRAGIFHCKGCDQPLYSSETKFESGTGWPSFYDNLPGAIGTKDDRKLFAVRTECHCSRCGSHLGHIFDDGPEPTGKRHCLNGVSLTFAPSS
ncbi:peptide-methionine (R)-S-oxide reductase MsrB [Maritimibacter alexandrii]|uniref:peptide-methionine (R)-S-oxide reductase MsrB n=1 Tax=Maritimibacter alexandrii TaxID=2570355 RepID=UPI001107E43A|nr:peptide-methionine (R)-S-oxide reductase MsrB [Maritimibacter alexandrii]